MANVIAQISKWFFEIEHGKIPETSQEMEDFF